MQNVPTRLRSAAPRFRLRDDRQGPDAGENGGDLALAEEMMRKVVGQAPEDPLALANLGWVLVNRDKLKEALPLLQEAVKAAPENPEIHYYISVTLEKLGRPKEAADRLRIAHERGRPKDYATTQGAHPAELIHKNQQETTRSGELEFF